MSGIFKGDSIYKSGGGGGGYKDGGQLVDGDFIEVKNNTVSSYENVNRDPVNFYFDVKNGEVINSTIEFSTQVNSNINVYVIQNGLLVSLKLVGSNTVTSGKDYTITIIGDSYFVYEATPSSDIGGAVIDGDIYPCEKKNLSGNNYLISGNLKGGEKASGIIFSPNRAQQKLQKIFDSGWTLFNNVVLADIETNGNNYSLGPYIGMFDPTFGWDFVGNYVLFDGEHTGTSVSNFIYWNSSNVFQGGGSVTQNTWCCLRVMKRL